MDTNKEKCKKFALQIKKDIGKFPIQKSWIVKRGFPIGHIALTKLFGSYSNFREYCGETHPKRIEEISIKWIKTNCTIDKNNCWNWNRYINEQGYGMVSVKDRPELTHRLTYLLQNKEIPVDLVVRHKCDNRKCCNPEHLEIGNRQDNAFDMLKRKKI